MKVNIQGYKTYSFKDNSGKLIEGETIYFTYVDENVAGLATEKCSVSLSKAVYPQKFPAPADIIYNMRGRVQDIIFDEKF